MQDLKDAWSQTKKRHWQISNDRFLETCNTIQTVPSTGITTSDLSWAHSCCYFGESTVQRVVDPICFTSAVRRSHQMFRDRRKTNSIRKHGTWNLVGCCILLTHSDDWKNENLSLLSMSHVYTIIYHAEIFINIRKEFLVFVTKW